MRARSAAKLATWRRAYRARHLAQGLCIYCPAVAVSTHTMCFRHLMANRDRAQAYFVRTREVFNAKRRAKHAERKAPHAA